MWRTCPLGRTGAQSLGGSRGFSRNVLKLERHHRNVAGEFADGIQVFVRSVHLEICHLAGRGVFIGRKGMNAVTHAPRRDGEHAAELPAAQHANSAAGEDRFGRGGHSSRSCRTALGLRSRQMASCSRNCGCLAPSMLAASSAALVAPAGPMASVPTGTPAGI